MHLWVILLQVGVVVISLGHQNHEGFLRLYPSFDKQLRQVIQVCRVRFAGAAEGQELFLPSVPDWIGKGMLP